LTEGTKKEGECKREGKQPNMERGRREKITERTFEEHDLLRRR
jgi:hypothetical protein